MTFSSCLTRPLQFGVYSFQVSMFTSFCVFLLCNAFLYNVPRHTTLKPAHYKTLTTSCSLEKFHWKLDSGFTLSMLQPPET